MPGWTKRGINHFQPDDGRLHIVSTWMSVSVCTTTTVPDYRNAKMSDHWGTNVRILTKMVKDAVWIRNFYHCYPF